MPQYPHTHMTVTPAYGRDYKSKKAATDDWNAGKDFVDAWSGQYVNKQDACQAGVNEVNIRYKRNTLVAVLRGFCK